MFKLLLGQTIEEHEYSYILKREFVPSARRRLGQPADATIVGDDVADLYAPRLPQWLRDFWQTAGIGSYRNGYFWLCLPKEFDGVLSEILSSFPDLHAADFAIFGYTSNSVLYVLDRFGGMYWLYVNLSYIISFNTDDESLINKSGVMPGIMAATKWMDDDLTAHMEAVAKLGPLNRGEVFGYFPAMQLGGAPKIANLRRTNAQAHWSFVAQLQPFRFRDNRSGSGPGDAVEEEA